MYSFPTPTQLFLPNFQSDWTLIIRIFDTFWSLVFQDSRCIILQVGMCRVSILFFCNIGHLRCHSLREDVIFGFSCYEIPVCYIIIL